ncbi:MAG: hypothetical protein ACR5LF_11805 [Symbiopectobacterium sp.]
MADDVDIASQNEEAFRQHLITNHREKELPVNGRCYRLTGAAIIAKSQPRVIFAAKNVGKIGKSENILIANGGLNDAT